MTDDANATDISAAAGYNTATDNTKGAVSVNVEIHNPDNLPGEFIRSEIAEVERERGRKVKRAEFYRQDGESAREVFEWFPVGFERIRRITGYLVGTTDRWNDAKREEEKDRLKHA